MKQEEKNQKLREGDFYACGYARIPTEMIEALSTLYGGTAFVSIGDMIGILKTLDAEMRQATPDPGSAVCFFTEEVVRAVLMCSAVVNQSQSKLRDPAKKAGEEERLRLANAYSQANKVAGLTRRQGVTYEDFVRAMQKTDSPEMIERILKNLPKHITVVTPEGTPLPPISPPPKALPSGMSHRVYVRIVEVPLSSSTVMVRITRAKDPSACALKDLLGKTLQASLPQTAGELPVDRKFLLTLCLLDVEIEVTAAVSHALLRVDAAESQLHVREVSAAEQLVTALCKGLLQQEAQLRDYMKPGPDLF